MNILITGATGFVGEALVKLLSNNANIFRAVRSKHEIENSQDILIGSIDENTNWKPVLNDNDIDIVIHLAAKVHDMKFKEDNSLTNDFYTINYKGTKKLVDDAKGTSVKKIVFLSTIKVNGESNNITPYSENDTTKPIGSYAKSKEMAEQYLINNSNEIKYVIIRPTLIFGPNVKGNILTLMKIIAKGIPFPYFKRPNKRSMIGLKNLCEFISFCINTNKCDNQILLVSEKEPISTEKLVRIISKYVKNKYIMLKLPNFLNFIFKFTPFLKKIYTRLYGDLLIDNSKLYYDINWKPRYTIDEQIEEMVNVFKEKK